MAVERILAWKTAAQRPEGLGEIVVPAGDQVTLGAMCVTGAVSECNGEAGLPDRAHAMGICAAIPIGDTAVANQEATPFKMHPSSSALDLYRLGDMQEPQVRAVSNHLLWCRECRRIVLNARDLSTLVRAVGERNTILEYTDERD